MVDAAVPETRSATNTCAGQSADASLIGDANARLLITRLWLAYRWEKGSTVPFSQQLVRRFGRTHETDSNRNYSVEFLRFGGSNVGAPKT